MYKTHPDKEVVRADRVPVHGGQLHHRAHPTLEDEGVVLLIDGVELAVDGGGLVLFLAGHLHPDVGVSNIPEAVTIWKVLEEEWKDE